MLAERLFALVGKPKHRIIFLGTLVLFLILLLISRRSLLDSERTSLTFSDEDQGLSKLDGSNEYQGDDDVKNFEEEDPESVIDEDEMPEQCKTPLHFLDSEQRRKNPVALASFPGSGNTWLRFLIEQGSRVYTGSAYQDSALNETYMGEGVMGTKVVAVKTHYPCPNCWTYQRCGWCAGTLPVTAEMTGVVKGADAAVFMLRSPFDALLAEFHRLRTGQHAGKMEPEAFTKVPAKKSYESEYDKPTWGQFINQRLVAYAMAARTYLDQVTTAKSPKEALKQKSIDASKLSKDEFVEADRFISKGGKLTKLVFYERLKADPEKELTKVFEFFQDIYEAENIKGAILTPPSLASKCSAIHNKRAQKSHFKWLRNNTEVFNPWKKWQIKQVCDVLGKWWFTSVWGKCEDGLLQVQRQ